MEQVRLGEGTQREEVGKQGAGKNITLILGGLDLGSQGSTLRLAYLRALGGSGQSVGMPPDGHCWSLAMWALPLAMTLSREEKLRGSTPRRKKAWEAPVTLAQSVSSCPAFLPAVSFGGCLL